MRFSIAHRTRYSYVRPVFVEPLTIRLRPRPDLEQHVEAFTLDVTPTPAGMQEAVDAEGNVVTRAWFEGVTDELVIATSSTVVSTRLNPYDFVIIDPDALRVPMTYLETAALARFRVPEGDPGGLAAELMAQSSGDALAFLSGLNQAIYERIEYVHRPLGEPMPAPETLARGAGSCRDLAVLFMQAARAAGFAARFASGYQTVEEVEGDREMHAWPEVYLDGAGWRGFDPALGLAVGHEHVAVAVGPTPASAAPTQGTIRSDDPGERLEVTIEIEAH